MAGKAIYTEGMGHKSPIPAAKLIGNVLASGLITGTDPATNDIPDSLEEQSRHMFAQIRQLMETAGGSTDDILQIRIWLNDRKDRTVFADAWLEMFPDPATRPARMTLNRELGGKKKIECELLAVIGS